MPYVEREIERLYYQIGEVSAMFGVETSCIRFWLEYFQIPIKKNRAGKRYFTKEDIEKVGRVHHLLKEELYTLPGAKKKLQNG